MSNLQCYIVGAEKSIFNGEVEQVIAAGLEGDLGILSGHVPLMTELKPGPVRLIKADGSEEVFYVSSGFLEVTPHEVNILADTAERAQDLDEAAAQEAIRAAEAAMKDKKTKVDLALANADLAQAAAQLRTLRSVKKRR